MNAPFADYVRKTRVRKLVILWLLGILISFLQLVSPTQFGALTDLFQSSATPAWHKVNLAIATLLVAQTMVCVLSYLHKLCAQRVRQHLIQSMTNDVFKRLLRFSPEFYQDEKPQTITARALDDTRVVGDYWSEVCATAPLAMLSLVVFGSYMFWTNWLLALCFLPLSFLNFYFLLFDRNIQRVNRRIRDHWDEVRVRANEIVSAAAEIRNHGAFDHAMGLLHAPIEAYFAATMVQGKWQGLFRAIGPYVNSLQTYVLYWCGAALCISGARLFGVAGELTWGKVLAFLIVSSMFREPVQVITNLVVQSRMTRESRRRVREYFAEHVKFSASDGLNLDTCCTITLDHVTVTAKTGANILADVCASIAEGRHVAIVGPAGSGKSTAIQLVVQAVEPTTGALLLGDKDISAYDISSLASNIGLVPQAPVMFDTSIRQNLLFGLRRPGKSAFQDENGPLDVGSHEYIRTPKDLDCALVAVVRRVGLDTDVFVKALDSPLSADKKFDDLRNRLPQLCAAVRHRICAVDPGLVSAFELEQVLTPASIRENLFGPGVRDQQEIDTDAVQILGVRDATSDVSLLLGLGHSQYLADRSLAARAAQRAPRLAELLACGSANAHVDDLNGISSSRYADLTDTERLTILNFALDLDTERATRIVAANVIERVLLRLRHLLRGCPRNSSDRWATAVSGQPVAELTLRENILGGRVNSHIYRGTERVDELVRSVLDDDGVLDQVLLAGLEYRVGENGKRLSGGQRQKVAIARTLLKNPRILLLDEATANLDELSQSRIVEMVRRDFAGKTVLSISHRLSTIMSFDEVLVLDRGRVVQQGVPSQLAGQPGLFRSMISKELLPAEDYVVSEVLPEVASQRPVSLPTVVSGVANSLRNCDLFSELDSTQIAALERSSRVFTCPANTVLFRRGDVGDELFLICEGHVEFVASVLDVDAAQPDVVDEFGPGQVFGEVAMFGDVPRTLSARARTPVTVVALSREDIFDLIDADPSIALRLLRVLAQRIATMRNQIDFGR